MTATIDIDTGGTFTDGYFTRDGRTARVKVDTTPHDLTECLRSCVESGAEKLGYRSVGDLLLATEVCRFSSTIGTNSIIQRSGPRIGLLVSRGAEGALYGVGESSLFDFLLRKDLVAGIADPFDETEVRQAVRQLLVGGSRVLVASLEDSSADPSGEQAIKKVVQEEYPRHYLGSVPVLLASDVTPRPDPEVRTQTAVINAYLHPDMVRTLYKADEDLRGSGHPNPLLIVHASGGCARVAKTRAVETYNSGPVGGVHGAASMARAYDLPKVVAMDIGGTSTDVSLIEDGAVAFEEDPQVAGLDVHVPMVRVGAVGGGGGSIASRADDGTFHVGPESAGAVPGPACYGLGGTRPTATDAEVVLGAIDPDWFLGGRRRLDRDRAGDSIARIAEDVDVGDAAWKIHDALVRVAADEVSERLERSGWSPADVVLFAFGGGGGLYGADVARHLGVPAVYTFDAAPVFSAFGISGMDVSHVYEVPLGDPLPEALEEARRRARLDVKGEGLDADALDFAVEVDAPEGLQVLRVGDDLAVVAGVVNALSPPPAGARLRATVGIPHAPLPDAADAGRDPSGAEKGRRTLQRGPDRCEVTVYDWDRLAPGNVVEGPRLVEAVDTTLLVPEDARLVLDGHRTGQIDLT